eukprot:PLAT10441.1.p1 GENE.PLAT10441.1~~PLAT10441.1.p1  ORF type:complete len:294 (-),score=101.76 PLAT10441.1:60-941(-)
MSEEVVAPPAPVEAEDAAAAAAAASATEEAAPPAAVEAGEAEEAAATSDELKAKGNRKFGEGKFDEAAALYQQAIAVAPEDPLLWGNLAAAQTKSGEHDAAIESAKRAVELDAAYLKGYHRMAIAYSALSREREACRCYERALMIVPGDAWLHKQLRKAWKRFDAKGPIECEADWLGVFSRAQVRLRMATMATLWNVALPEQRMAIFSRFLEVLSGAGGAPSLDLKPEHFPALPMENYADVKVPAPWLRYFASMEEAGARTAVFEAMWDVCSPEEKNLIIGDMKQFFARLPRK